MLESPSFDKPLVDKFGRFVAEQFASIGGRVEVPRCGLDPHPKARRLIQQAIGLDNPEDLKTNWDIRFNTDYKTHTRPEGWRSTVVYRVSD